jgi:hypothetical protein
MPTVAVDLDDSLFSMEFIDISLTMVWKSGKITKKNQSIMVMAYKGLGYHPIFRDNAHETPEGWVVTHLKSGLAIGYNQKLYGPDGAFKKEETAAKFLLAIVDFFDWTLEYDVLKNQGVSAIVKSRIKTIYDELLQEEDKGAR